MDTSPSSRARRVRAALVEMIPSARVVWAIKSTATSFAARPSTISRWTKASLSAWRIRSISGPTVRMVLYSRKTTFTSLFRASSSSASFFTDAAMGWASSAVKRVSSFSFVSFKCSPPYYKITSKELTIRAMLMTMEKEFTVQERP